MPEYVLKNYSVFPYSVRKYFYNTVKFKSAPVKNHFRNAFFPAFSRKSSSKYFCRVFIGVFFLLPQFFRISRHADKSPARHVVYRLRKKRA
jgi:hypothetical protein